MIGMKSRTMRPDAFGLMLQSSSYGAAIPSLYGRVCVPGKLIWTAGLRHGGGGKKGKGWLSKLTGAPPNWVMGVDFLLGSNPILKALQIWRNQNEKFGLNFIKWTGSPTFSTWDVWPLTVPDPLFYAPVAVTIDVPLSGTFNDYGGTGPVPYSGTYELPLWNAWFNGPDLINASSVRRYPGSYYWAPGSGATLDVSQAAQINPSSTYNVYYAQLRSFGVPLAHLNLTWENQLGNGPQFAYLSKSAQQIIYPYYAGCGSNGLDLGISSMIPNLRFELAASYGLNAPDGDADFADIIEDIFKSGTMALETQLGEIHRGLNCGQLPGLVQQNGLVVGQQSTPRIPFYRPNKAGSPLIAACIFRPTGLGPPTISDTAGNAWTLIYSDDTRGFWYCPSAVAFTGNVVKFVAGGGGTQYNGTGLIGEMDPDSKLVDATASNHGTGGTAQVSITVDAPCFILAILFAESGPFLGETIPVHWTEAFAGIGVIDSRVRAAWRYVSTPGTYTFGLGAGVTNSWCAAAFAFKSQDPVSYPKPLGNILDDATMQLCRAQCTANGLWGSLSMQNQQNASQWLKDLYLAMNAWPVWSGFKLKSVPMSEVSAAGNGVVYAAPTASGPLADLNDVDFIADGSNPVISIARKPPVDSENILQMRFTDRAADYADVTISEPDSGGLSLYGPRKAAPQTLSCIADPTIGRMLLGIAVRRKALIRNTYSFKLKAQWQLLEPGDLVTINEPKLNISKLPVRLTSVEENDKFELQCEAEPFIYGMNAPVALPITAPAPNVNDVNEDAGNVNTPVIFEPVPHLSPLANQLWLVVSSPSAVYGGCEAFISTDGGLSYNLIGTIIGNAITGVSTADWPAHSDPDTTNDLPVDLTESLGALASYQVSDEDNFIYPCYMAGGSGGIPYELMTYAVATLTATNKYTLKATGAGNKLRRAVFGAPTAGAGVDHPSGSRFAFLNSGAGVLKITFDPKLIGTALQFKLCSFNVFGGGLQDISTVTAYAYTPGGTVGIPQNILLVNGG